MVRRVRTLVPWCVFFLLMGCGPRIPKDALRLSAESLQVRQAETRRFDTTNEATLLNASAAVLQDLGFSIEEVSAPLGVLVANKQRSAVSAAQVTGAVVVALLVGVPTAIDTHQTMRASLVTRPFADGQQTAVRITFQRIVLNNQGQVTQAESIIDPQAHQEFFAKLSKSVFLQANEL